MYQDTWQCQDVLLSNQHRQNDKLDINEFDKFPLVEPPLDDDPFAFLTPTELAAMGATLGPSIAVDDDGSNEYQGDKDGGEDDNDEWPLSMPLLSFFFIFGTLMPKGEKKFYLCLVNHFYLDLACKNLI
jgi:hypothetical protein